MIRGLIRNSLNTASRLGVNNSSDRPQRPIQSRPSASAHVTKFGNASVTVREYKGDFSVKQHGTAFSFSLPILFNISVALYYYEYRL